MTARIPLLFLGICFLASLSACKTQRTVLAGPTVTSLDIKETGSKGSGGFDARFNSADPFGYNQNASNKDGKGGLNAMSEKMFGGQLESQSKKEYTATKDFLTREYGGKKSYKTSDWKDRGKNSPNKWNDQLFATQENKDGNMAFREGSKEAGTKTFRDAGKNAATKDFNEAGKNAPVNDYYPAEKALSDGRDKPKLANAQSGDPASQDQTILQRIKNSQATASEINKYLGKP
ncbi:MAG: hypothetical protein JWM59_3338 [Verrucomicrobiales bacterium]|nr:hypothetical protein [Verrucomicrobiales bacterium]